MKTVLLLPLLLVSSAFGQGGDDCSSAVAISGEWFEMVDNTANTTSGFGVGTSCDHPAMVFDQFFQWTASVSGRYVFRAHGDYNQGFTAKVALFDGTGCAATCLSGSANFNLFGGVAYYTAQAGDTLLLQYGGTFSGSVGFSAPLEIEMLEGDVCEYPVDISGVGNFGFSATGLSGSGFTGSVPCLGNSHFAVDYFMHWVAPSSGDFRFNSGFTQAAFGTNKLAVYEGTGCAGACLGFDTSPMVGGQRAEVSLAGVQAGAAYMIRVGGVGNATGGDLEITSDLCSVPDAFEPNDSFGQAPALPQGLNQDLNVPGGGADFYRITLAPGEAAYLQATTTSGPAVEVRRYGLSGSVIYTPPGLGPGDPLWVNTYEEPQTFRLSVMSSAQGQSDCSTYELDLAIGPDPCGFGGVISPPTVWLEPGLNAGLPLTWAEWHSYRIVVPAGEELRLDYLSGPPPQGSYVLLRDPNHNVIFGNGSGVSWTNAGSLPVALQFSMHWGSPSNVYFLNECTTMDIQVTAGDALGAQYCSPGIVNTSGESGIMRAQGDALASANEFTLVALQLPPNEFAFFVGSQTQAFVPWAGGSRGHLCLGGALVRFNGQVGQISPMGFFARGINLSDVPEPPTFNTVVLAGQTWNFQLWHRDNLFGPASNFTNALSVTFQ